MPPPNCAHVVNDLRGRKMQVLVFILLLTGSEERLLLEFCICNFISNVLSPQVTLFLLSVEA